MSKWFTHLGDRAVLRISGADRVAFLQGLVSNDVEKVTDTEAVFAAFLTPQGKYLEDFFLIADADSLLLDGVRDRLEALTARLKRYKLRSDVTLTPEPELAVFACFGSGAEILPETISFADPRHADLGVRLIGAADRLASILAECGAVEHARSAYEELRIRLGIPDGARDPIPEQTLLLEARYDELNGIDFQKGCYMGQELTARTKYRGLVKKKLMPVRIDGPLPETGTVIETADGPAGEIRSGVGVDDHCIGIALLRLDKLDQPLRIGETPVSLLDPD